VAVQTGKMEIHESNRIPAIRKMVTGSIDLIIGRLIGDRLCHDYEDV
jgi:hypothetical protein